MNPRWNDCREQHVREEPLCDTELPRGTPRETPSWGTVTHIDFQPVPRPKDDRCRRLRRNSPNRFWFFTSCKGDNRNALAARGYYDAFVSVKASVGKVLAGGSAGEVSHNDHGEWYRQLFGPSVTAGIISAPDLAGYRTGPVHIRRSMHVPPPREAVRDCMPVLFELLDAEPEPSVRVVLGDFVFVYIHPYMDGNGRIGRFLMNVMLASGGYPWTIVPLERRDDYMAALETASVRQEIRPFAELVGGAG